MGTCLLTFVVALSALTVALKLSLQSLAALCACAVHGFSMVHCQHSRRPTYHPQWHLGAAHWQAAKGARLGIVANSQRRELLLRGSAFSCGLFPSLAPVAASWGPRNHANEGFVEQTVLQVLAEAPGRPRSIAQLPEEELVLLQIWTVACTYSIDSELVRAGGRQAWAGRLHESLRRIRARSAWDFSQQPRTACGNNVACTAQRLVDAADELLAGLGDPYAQYFPPEEWGEAESIASGAEVAGVGVAFGQDTTRGRGGPPEVVAVVRGSSADRGGVQTGDQLLSVDGAPVSRPADAARLIPGPVGSQAVLRFARRQLETAREAKEYTLTLERRPMRVDPVEACMLPLTTVPQGPSNANLKAHSTGIGYLRIRTFNGPDVLGPAKASLRKLTDEAGTAPAGGLIVDLRGNLGGRLREARAVAAEIARTADARPGTMGSLVTPAPPVALLVGARTASAAELLASELHAFPSAEPATFSADGIQAESRLRTAAQVQQKQLPAGRLSVLISCGENPPAKKTFGKSEEQEAVPLSDGGVLLLTTSRWAPATFDGLKADVLCGADGVPHWIQKPVPPPHPYESILIGEMSKEPLADNCIRCATLALLRVGYAAAG